MNDKNKISEILKKYFEFQESTLDNLQLKIDSDDIKQSIENSKNEVLKEMELHNQAHEFVEDEVIKFREELYLYSKRIANRELEENIITKSHVLKAREFLWRKKAKYNWSDGFLTLGGLFCGISIPQLIFITDNNISTEANIWMILLGFIGGFLMGMGIISKAKQ